MSLLSKDVIIQKYKKDVEYLRKCAKSINLSDNEIDIIFSSCMKIIEKRKNLSQERKPKRLSRAQKLVTYTTILLCLFTIIYVLLNVHQATSSIVLRNVQGLIYPGLKLLRFLSVPVIKQFPSLTNLYDESCLLENPFFYVHDMECWPCENIHSVIDLTGCSNHSLYQSGVPYIVKTEQPLVTYHTIQELYRNNTECLNKEANTLKSNNPKIYDISDLLNFEPSTEVPSGTHITWRINRMGPGRVIRSLFPRPYIISEWSGQSIERYVMIDEVDAQGYKLPNTECSYVSVVQSSGQRTIILKPSKECISHCKTVSVILKPSYVLWYNWWYWRPLSLPVKNATETSVTYISSYC